MTKKDLRIWAKNERSKLNMEDISQQLVSKVRQTDEYINSKHVMIYYPMPYEVNLLSLMNDTDKKFYLPKINKEELLCCPYNIVDELLMSNFKTKEPLTEPVDKSIPDIIFVPALVCDENNYRLGYGGGFYDRFLKDVKATTVSCIPKQLIVTTIQPEIFDISVTKVITA